MRREVFEPVDVTQSRDNSIDIKVGDEVITLYLTRIFMNDDPFDNHKTRLAYVNFEKKVAIELTMDHIDILKPQHIREDKWSGIKISCIYCRVISPDHSDSGSKKRLTKKYYELFALWEPCDHLGKRIIND